MNLSTSIGLLISFLNATPSFGQVKFEATALSMREALRRGEIREFISFMEAKAEEAEKNGNWDEAARAYNLASLASRHNGQLQKAISHGNKGLEIAEKLNHPRLQGEARSSAVRALSFMRGCSRCLPLCGGSMTARIMS